MEVAQEVKTEMVFPCQEGIIRENWLRWFGHLHRADCRKQAKDIMSMNGKRGRGRPRTRWKDNIKKDMQELNLTGEDAEETMEMEDSGDQP